MSVMKPFQLYQVNSYTGKNGVYINLPPALMCFSSAHKILLWFDSQMGVNFMHCFAILCDIYCYQFTVESNLASMKDCMTMYHKHM